MAAPSSSATGALTAANVTSQKTPKSATDIIISPTSVRNGSPLVFFFFHDVASLASPFEKPFHAWPVTCHQSSSPSRPAVSSAETTKPASSSQDLKDVSTDEKIAKILKGFRMYECVFWRRMCLGGCLKSLMVGKKKLLVKKKRDD